MKKYILFLILAFTFLPAYAIASVEISEIMYDLTNPEGDTDREWIEVHNLGSDDVDLSKWNFYDTSHHALTPVGSSILSGGSYAVIVQDLAKFKVDWPNFTGLIFTANLPSLGNDGDTLKLKNNNDKSGPVEDTVTYSSSMGGTGDGNSLQKIGSAFVGASPTPGAQNSGSSSTQNNNSSGGSANTSSSGTTTTIIKPKEVVVPKITTEIIMKSSGIAGIPFLISSNILGYSKEPLSYGRAFWNFGDGSSRDKTLPEENFHHTYKYPGEYVVTLSYYENVYTKEPRASDRFIVSVFAPSIVISSIGDTNDPYVELENKSDREVDLSSWVLRGSLHSFTLPEGTILLPKKKIILSPEITSFDGGDLKNIDIFRSGGGAIVSSFPDVGMPQLQPSYPVKSSYVNTDYEGSIQTSNHKKDAIDLSQTASAANAIEYNYFPFMWLGVIIALGLASMYFIKGKKVKDNIDEDELTASDIKIIE